MKKLAPLFLILSVFITSCSGPEYKYLNGCQPDTCIKIGENTPILFNLDVKNLDQKYEYKEMNAEISINGKASALNANIVKLKFVQDGFKDGISVNKRVDRVTSDHMGRIRPRIDVKILPFVKEGDKIEVRIYGKLAVAELDDNNSFREVEHSYDFTFSRIAYEEVTKLVE